MSNAPSPYGGRTNAFDPAYPYEFYGGYSNSKIPEKAAKAQQTFSVDWVETATEHVVMADIPGLTKEDVKVQMDDGKVLEISFERIGHKVGETDNWHRQERTTGKCSRRFPVPENVVGEKVTARLDKGVLTVTLAKNEAKNDKIKVVEISG